MTFFETARRAVSQQMMASHAEIEAWKLDQEMQIPMASWPD